MPSPTDIEKESLEAHVELCAIRYNNLENKLSNLEQRLDKLELHIVDIKKSLDTTTKDSNKQTISIFQSVLGVLLAGLIGFIASGIFK
jgi:predicted  nucleic acid-binding Zn-ribbon protein